MLCNSKEQVKPSSFQQEANIDQLETTATSISPPLNFYNF